MLFVFFLFPTLPFLLFSNSIWISGSITVPQWKNSNNDTRSSYKSTNNILKRGRTIINRRHELIKSDLKPNFSKITNTCQSTKEDLKINDLTDLNSIISQKDTEFDNSDKESIKLSNKLISEKEVKLYPPFESKDNLLKSTENSKKQYFTERQSSTELDDSNAKALNIEIANLNNTNLSEYLETNEDCSKLNVQKASASEGNANANLSLLKNITGIQTVGTNSYGIKISNSQFFVPKNYIYSGMENAMDDLKFEVDPEMKKVLEKSTQINNSINTYNFEVINIKQSEYTNESGTGDSFSPDVKDKNSSVLQALKFKEEEEERKNDWFLNKERELFLNISEPRFGSEIVDSFLDIDNKQNVFNSTLKNRCFSTSLNNLNLRTYSTDDPNSCDIVRKIRTNEDFSTFNDYEQKNAISFKDTNDRVSMRLKSVPIEPGLYQKSKDSDFLNIQKEQNKDNENHNTFSILCSLENLPTSALEAPLTPLISRFESRKPFYSKDSTQESDFTLTQRVTSEPLKFDNEQQETKKNITLREANRLKRIKFLNMNLSQSEPNTESKLCSSANGDEKKIKNESSNLNSDSKFNLNSNNLLFKDISLIGRTSSLREKFEMITEDVELRSGRQIGTISDRKSPK